MLRSPMLKVVSRVVLGVFPSALFAADSSPAAMLYVHGVTMLNGTNVPSSSALFPGDLVQTAEHSVANINASGSVVLVLNESLIQYRPDGLTLKRGGVRVSTSKALVARNGDVTVSPTDGVWTDFEVQDLNGTVQIAARKGDLLITDTTGTSRLAQGQETTRDDSQSQENRKKKDKRKGAGAEPAARGALMNSPIAVGIAAGAIVGVAAWVLLQGEGEQPASPVK
jgi:hypothetical protein